MRRPTALVLPLAMLAALALAGTASAGDGLLSGTLSPVTQAVSPVTDAVAPVTEAAKPVTDAAAPVTEAAAPVPDAVAPVTKAVAPVTQAVAPVTQAAQVLDSTKPVAPTVRTVAEAAAPVVSAVSKTTAAAVEPVVTVAAPAVEAVAGTAAPVVGAVVQTAAPVVNTVATVVDQNVAPVKRPAGRTTTQAVLPTSLVSQPPTIGEEATAVASPQTSTRVPSHDADELPASTPVAQGAAGGAAPARPALAGGTPSQIEPLAPGIPPSISALEPPAPTTVAAPVATASAGQSSATVPGQSRGPLPRDVGLALLGGFLVFGIALVSTTSAGAGGHSPSSPVAVTTRPFRLVAPALRWRLRALAECVRPGPLLAPLELPG